MDYEKLLYDRATSTLRVHGILSIVFGSFGVLGALITTIFIALGTIADSSFDPYYGSTVGLFILGLVIFIFWTLPHIYMIVAGYHLTREPAVKVARTLVIINLVIGVFWNLVLLIFAIINLTQLSDYERGRMAHKKHAHKA